MADPAVLIVNQTDILGGSARNSWDLYQGLLRAGVRSCMAVGFKFSKDSQVKVIPRSCPSRFPLSRWFWDFSFYLHDHYEGKVRGATRLQPILRSLASPKVDLQKSLGWEDFNFPGSHKILNLFSENINLVHLFNLHIDYFDLRFLPELSQRVPTVLTLLDTWLFAGHCGYPLGCERWLTGCGSCPKLSVYSPIRRDASAFNWQRKKEIYSRSQLFIAAPCQWMIDWLGKSILQQAVREARVIPSGVDQTVFHPANRRQARIDLGLPEDALILLFVAQRMRQNPFKDYETIQRAVQIVSSQKNSREVLFLSLGSTENDTVHQDLNIRHIPFTSDITLVAWYYQAADIYLHAAHEDTFPNVVLEALSCGVPVIATAVGGIPEQIIDGKTGFLVPPRDAEAIARQILILLNDPAACWEMGQNAQEDARSRFNLDLMVSRYRDYYRHIQEVS